MRLGGELLWNGVNEVVRERFPGATVRVRHELSTRSDMLLASDGSVPQPLAAWNPPLEPYLPPVQFSRALFETKADAYVLSMQPDVMTATVRHRHDGFKFYPANLEKWPATDRRKLREEYDEAAVLDVATSMQGLARIVELLRERTEAPILIYNLSSVILGDSVHSHAGMEDALSTRIRRFNLGLVELSQ